VLAGPVAPLIFLRALPVKGLKKRREILKLLKTGKNTHTQLV